jgi:hypothetical protein
MAIVREGRGKQAWWLRGACEVPKEMTRVMRRGREERKQVVIGWQRSSGYCLCTEGKGEGIGVSEPPEI